MELIFISSMASCIEAFSVMVIGSETINVRIFMMSSFNKKLKPNPNVAKVGGLQSQDAEGEAVVNLLRTLGNAGSGVLRLSRRLNNMASNSSSSFEFTRG